jgi:VCBS repeat-containing protein
VARRKRKEEQPIWTPPEFDEVGYMRKEIENAKIALVVIAWAVVGAFLTYILYAYVLPVVGFLAGLAAFGALYFVLPALGIPIHGFKRRDWISHASVYFFSWLAFSIIVLNPPFTNHTDPVVGSFQVGTFTSNVTLPAVPVYCISTASGSIAQLASTQNHTLLILFRATDNVAIRTVQVSVNGANATATNVGNDASLCNGTSASTMLPNTYAVTVPINTNSWTVNVVATDTSGLSSTESIKVQIL